MRIDPFSVPRLSAAVLAALVPQLALAEVARAAPARPLAPLDEPLPRALGEASVAVTLGAELRPPANDWRAGLLVSLPLERVASSPRRTSASASPRAGASPEPAPEARAPGTSPLRASTPKKTGLVVTPGRSSEPATPAPASSSSPPRPDPAPPLLVSDRTLRRLLALSGRDLREATEAALRASGHATERAQLLELSRRARWSSALPQLRVRVARASSENAALMPTSYDPLRQTASGGTTTWLEARATWSLDRAVFGSEELRLVRHAEESRRAEDDLARRVATLLFEWQEAVAERLDPSASFRECRRAHVRELSRGAELDRLTNGWFERFRARRPPLPEAECLTIAERVEP